MTSFVEFLVTLVKAFAGVVGILVAGFVLILVMGRVNDKLRGAKYNVGELVAGALMLLVGSLYLRSGRSALLYHTPVYYKGSLYPLQALVGGGLCFVFGLCLLAHATYRAKKPRGGS